MNILPKKSWHVRNKDNVARVRRDEAQAREEEKERERRVLLAEQEARTEFLRKKARQQSALPALNTEAGTPGSGPVDLFRDLLVEGKGVTKGNKEYEEEKRQEKERQEKALGILTYLGQSAAEAQTQPPWYQLPPKRGDPQPGPGPDEKIKSRLDPMWEMQKHLQRKRKHSSGGGSSNRPRKELLETRPNVPPTLNQLRAERLQREAAERARAQALLARVQGHKPQEGGLEEEETDDRHRRYNSQFNPQLARRPRRQDAPPH